MRISFARSDADGRDEENACRLKSIRRRNGEGNPDVHATQRVGRRESEKGTSFRWEEERVKCRTWRDRGALSLFVGGFLSRSDCDERPNLQQTEDFGLIKVPMSRHRLVRNLDYNGQPEIHPESYQTRTQPITPRPTSAELQAFDGFSDSQEEEMTEEQHGAQYRCLCELLQLLTVFQRK